MAKVCDAVLKALQPMLEGKHGLSEQRAAVRAINGVLDWKRAGKPTSASVVRGVDPLGLDHVARAHARELQALQDAQRHNANVEFSPSHVEVRGRNGRPGSMIFSHLGATR